MLGIQTQKSSWQCQRLITILLWCPIKSNTLIKKKKKKLKMDINEDWRHFVEIEINDQEQDKCR